MAREIYNAGFQYMCIVTLGLEKAHNATSSAFDILHPHHVLQSPANKPYFRVQ